MVHPSSAPGLPVGCRLQRSSDSLVLQFVGVACCELPRDKLIWLVLDGGEGEWREGKRKEKALGMY